MASIDRRRTAKGETRWEVRYRTPEGSERSRTFTTRRDANRHASTVEADKLRGAWVDPRRAGRTFADLAADWLKSTPTKRPSAWARDESIVRVHLTPALGTTSLSHVTPAKVRGLVTEWSAKMRPRSVRRVYGTLRAIFAFAVASEDLVASPCRGVKLPEVEPITRTVVTSDQLARLADAIGPDYEALPYLGAVLGLRWGECAGLRVHAVDILGGRVTVTEQATRGMKGATVFGPPPKSTAGRRTLAVPKALCEMLSAQLKRRGVTAANPDALVFTMDGGGVLDHRNFRLRVWIPACVAAGVGTITQDPATKKKRYEGLTFHDLRRANATGLVLSRVDLKTAQTRLGHSDPRLTLGVYAQATTEAHRGAADAMSERFIGAAGLGFGVQAVPS
jgi:integrase